MAEPRAISSLDWRGSEAAPGGDLVIAGARVLDPGAASEPRQSSDEIALGSAI